MEPANDHLNVSEAAGRLGVTAKALRLYEQKGLIKPGRSTAGYRVYRQQDMASAAHIVALRALGLSLAQITDVLAGDARSLASALAAHEASLAEGMHRMADQVERVRQVRASLAQGTLPDAADIAGALDEFPAMRLSFALPWPWGGERFDIPDVHPLNYIVGPLGSGKTVLAQCIADAVAGGVFVDATQPAHAGHAESTEPGLNRRIEEALAWLIEDGAVPSPMLTYLLRFLESTVPSMLVIDSMEEHLDAASQEALMRYVRKIVNRDRRRLFLITRSTAILDLDAVGADEAIYFCPANHRAPRRVMPYRGAAGHESVDACLAPPAVRARTHGMIASIREG